MSADFSNFANLVSVVSGIMTILGVSGFLTWSIFKGRDGILSDKLLSIFSYSVKCALCVVLMVLLTLLLFFPWMMFVGLAGGDINALPFSGREWPIGNYVGTFVLGMLVVPIFIVLCVCIFEWSFGPVGRFLKAFRPDKVINKSRKTDG